MASDSPVQIRERITEIDAILRSGASSVTLDGLTVSWDPDALRRERSELEKKLPSNTRRRRIAFRNNLGGSC